MTTSYNLLWSEFSPGSRQLIEMITPHKDYLYQQYQLRYMQVDDTVSRKMLQDREIYSVPVLLILENNKITHKIEGVSKILNTLLPQLMSSLYQPQPTKPIYSSHPNPPTQTYGTVAMPPPQQGMPASSLTEAYNTGRTQFAPDSGYIPDSIKHDPKLLQQYQQTGAAGGIPGGIMPSGVAMPGMQGLPALRTPMGGGDGGVPTVANPVVTSRMLDIGGVPRAGNTQAPGGLQTSIRSNKGKLSTKEMAKMMAMERGEAPEGLQGGNAMHRGPR